MADGRALFTGSWHFCGHGGIYTFGGKSLHYDIADGSAVTTMPYVAMDITDAAMVQEVMCRVKPDVVVHCAAWTAVDLAEDEDKQDKVRAINADGTRYIAAACKALGCKMIYISTDYVFDGQGTRPWEPDDRVTEPLNAYGLSKYLGEQEVQRYLEKYYIVRIAWVFGINGKNFVKTMLNLTATKPQLKVVFDQVGTPTYAYDLAAAIYEIVSERKHEGNDGVYHFSNEGVCSWYDFTKVIAEYAGHTECDIQPCHSDEFPSPVKRPAYSVLDKTKIKQTFGVKVPYWTESLKVCLGKMKK